MERPKLSATMEPPRPKPKVKPNPRKVRPPTIRHRVKTGDTLYGLSRKYGTTVSKIQKANQLRGTIIINGSVLVIPR
jgi:LysM repeat protein